MSDFDEAALSRLGGGIESIWQAAIDEAVSLGDPISVRMTMITNAAIAMLATVMESAGAADEQIHDTTMAMMQHLEQRMAELGKAPQKYHPASGTFMETH